MRFGWYLNRLKKMSLTEVLKRLNEHLGIIITRIKYHTPSNWPYSRFAPNNFSLKLFPLPGIPVKTNWERYSIYNAEFDLTKPLSWYFSELNGSHWPFCHYSKINYRPGNPHGDVRINWELNRLQFLPAMAISEEEMAKSIIKDWTVKNPYVYGPSYLSSMEVALRWISIYRAVCLFKQPIDKKLVQNLTGLAVASGKFIEKRLSTHSSAGNHIIIEAIGLFWIGKSLEKKKMGLKWISLSREILWKEVLRQLNIDGTNKEQTFWYIGFVIDGLLNYMLLENLEAIPDDVLKRIEKSFEFINHMVLPDGSFPDYGDRDDGFVFRISEDYSEKYFAGLLNTGALFFNREEWIRDIPSSLDRSQFYFKEPFKSVGNIHKTVTNNNVSLTNSAPSIITFPNGGMTLMRRDEAGIIFRHNPLGLDPTFGHGHADTLSVLIYWKNTPVLIDLGSGQYNGDQNVRNYFRSTFAHNTVEIGKSSQADILGPFLWNKSFESFLVRAEKTPIPLLQGYHTGYKKKFGIIHNRTVEWPLADTIKIKDSFSGGLNMKARGAVHLGLCDKVTLHENIVESFFNSFKVVFNFPPIFNLNLLYGSLKPFAGWRSTIYGSWEAIHSIIYSFDLDADETYEIILQILES